MESQMGCVSTTVDATYRYDLLLRLARTVLSMLCPMNMVQHGKFSLYLQPLRTGIQIKNPRRLLLLPLSHKMERRHQFLKHLILILIREAHLRMILPLELQPKLNRRREWLRLPLRGVVSRPIQGYLEHTGIDACPLHQVDHGVRDPDCAHCKRALGPLYHHKITGFYLRLSRTAPTQGECCPIPLSMRLHQYCCPVFSPPLRISER